MTNCVELEFEEHIAIVTLSRPDKRNAVNIEMFEALADAGRDLAGRRALRAVVLGGTGEHFCAGLDTSIFQSSSSDSLQRRMAPQADTPANFFQHAALVWRELPVPVVAALQGAVYGAGLQMAMGADIRLAAPSTRCSVMEIRWGLIPDMALSITMRQLVRLDCLRELVYTGRVVAAEEAQALGLVTALVDDPLAAARDLARQIAGRSPDAVRAAKALLNGGFHGPAGTALRNEARLQQRLLGAPNQAEAVMANLEDRDPRFQDAAADRE